MSNQGNNKLRLKFVCSIAPDNLFNERKSQKIDDYKLFKTTEVKKDSREKAKDENKSTVKIKLTLDEDEIKYGFPKFSDGTFVSTSPIKYSSFDSSLKEKFDIKNCKDNISLNSKDSNVLLTPLTVSTSTQTDSFSQRMQIEQEFFHLTSLETLDLTKLVNGVSNRVNNSNYRSKAAQNGLTETENRIDLVKLARDVTTQTGYDLSVADVSPSSSSQIVSKTLLRNTKSLRTRKERSKLKLSQKGHDSNDIIKKNKIKKKSIGLFGINQAMVTNDTSIRKNHSSSIGSESTNTNDDRIEKNELLPCFEPNFFKTDLMHVKDNSLCELKEDCSVVLSHLQKDEDDYNNQDVLKTNIATPNLSYFNLSNHSNKVTRMKEKPRINNFLTSQNTTLFNTPKQGTLPIESHASFFTNSIKSPKKEKSEALKVPALNYQFLKAETIHFNAPTTSVKNPIIIKYFNDGYEDKDRGIALKDTGRKCPAEDKPAIQHKKLTNKSTSEFLSVNDGFNINSTPNLVFYKRNETVDKKGENLPICLCDSCFSAIQQAIDGNSVKQESTHKNKQSFSYDLKIDPNHIKAMPNYKTTSSCMDINSNDEEFNASMVKRLKDEGINEYAKVVNFHLLNMHNFDASSLKQSIKVLRYKWLKETCHKEANIKVIRFYLNFFQSLSENLCKMIVYTRDIKGNNVLHFAFSYNRFDIADLFLQYEYSKDLLTMKSKDGHSAFMICSVSEPQTERDWLVVCKAMQQIDVNEASDFSRLTPLMNAARRGSELMVQLLLNAKADPNLQDSNGSTALMYAIEHGKAKCAYLLLDHPKCDLTIKDNENETACSIALSAGHKDLALSMYLRTKTRNSFS